MKVQVHQSKPTNQSQSYKIYLEVIGIQQLWAIFMAMFKMLLYLFWSDKLFCLPPCMCVRDNTFNLSVSR